MNSEKIKEYTYRITNASSGQLLIINYELLLDSIDILKANIQDKKVDDFYSEVKRTKRILKQLIESLDITKDISKQLMSLYIYINRLIIKASVKFNSKPLLEAEELIKVLLGGWSKAVKEEKPNITMDNTQKVYAGLTYGKGTLNESIINNEKRGYKA